MASASLRLVFGPAKRFPTSTNAPNTKYSPKIRIISIENKQGNAPAVLVSLIRHFNDDVDAGAGRKRYPVGALVRGFPFPVPDSTLPILAVLVDERARAPGAPVTGTAIWTLIGTCFSFYFFLFRVEVETGLFCSCCQQHQHS